MPDDAVLAGGHADDFVCATFVDAKGVDERRAAALGLDGHVGPERGDD